MSWKIATFNVNGIRSRLDVLLSWIDRAKPDVLCLQEIKCQDPEFPVAALSEIGYRSSAYGQKSFHGVAIVSRSPAGEVRRGFGDGQSDEEARLIAARIDGIWVVNTYVPQGRSPEHAAFQDKLRFFRRLRALFEREFAPDDPLIWTGDINVAPEDVDVFSAKRMAGKVGVHPLEREALGEACAWGFTDLFRQHHPTEKQFTFWDYRLPESFRRNLGWRLDHIRATGRVAAASLACEVDMDLRGANTPSDHVPVWAEIDLEKL